MTLSIELDGVMLPFGDLKSFSVAPSKLPKSPRNKEFDSIILIVISNTLQMESTPNYKFSLNILNGMKEKTLADTKK
jgi:hypothetical protein